MLYKSVYCYQALNHSTCHYISSPVIFLQSLGRTICKLPMYVLWYVYYYTSWIMCSYSRSVKAHFQTSLCPRISSCYLHHNDRGKLKQVQSSVGYTKFSVLLTEEVIFLAMCQRFPFGIIVVFLSLSSEIPQYYHTLAHNSCLSHFISLLTTFESFKATKIIIS